MVVAELESRLDDKGGRVAGFGSGSVVGTGVAALGFNIWDRAVLTIALASAIKLRGAENLREAYLDDDLLDKFGQAGVNKISDDANTLNLAGIEGPLHEARHILLKHGLDIPLRLLVCLEDSLTAQKTTLLGRVPVELDRVLGLAFDDAING
jgi:hypothetical protein